MAELPLASSRTIEIQPSDIELLEAEADAPLAAEPVLAEESAAPVADEWASAPLAVDAEPGTAARAADTENPDAAPSDEDRMEITASYAIPAHPVSPPEAEPVPTLEADDVQSEPASADGTPTFDVSELEASPSLDAAPAAETPWETSAEESAPRRR